VLLSLRRAVPRYARHVILAVAAGVALPLAYVPALAQTPGSELTVYHAVFGPGDQVWENFGHNAIWIHDAGHRHHHLVQLRHVLL
jgi:hypothetical protein